MIRILRSILYGGTFAYFPPEDPELDHLFRVMHKTKQVYATETEDHVMLIRKRDSFHPEQVVERYHVEKHLPDEYGATIHADHVQNIPDSLPGLKYEARFIAPKYLAVHTRGHHVDVLRQTNDRNTFLYTMASDYEFIAIGKQSGKVVLVVYGTPSSPCSEPLPSSPHNPSNQSE